MHEVNTKLYIMNTYIFPEARCHLQILTEVTQQVSHRGPTNIRYHHTKFSCHGDLVHEICAPLTHTCLIILQYGDKPLNFGYDSKEMCLTIVQYGHKPLT
jgi:hypothetical protein